MGQSVITWHIGATQDTAEMDMQELNTVWKFVALWKERINITDLPHYLRIIIVNMLPKGIPSIAYPLSRYRRNTEKNINKDYIPFNTA